MKIKANVLHNWINKIYAGGSVEQALIHITKDGLECSALSADQTRHVLTTLSKGAFINYDGKKDALAIDKLKFFMSVIGLSGDGEITLEVKENRLRVISPSRKVIVALIDPDLAKDTTDPKLTYDGRPVKVSTVFLKRIPTDLEIFKVPTITLKTRPNVLELVFSNNDSLVEHTKADFKTSHEVVINAIIADPIKTLTEDEVKINLKTDYPLTIIEKGEHFTCVNRFAPIQEVK